MQPRILLTPLLGENQKGVISNQLLIQQMDATEEDEDNILDDNEHSDNNNIKQATLLQNHTKIAKHE